MEELSLKQTKKIIKSAIKNNANDYTYGSDSCWFFDYDKTTKTWFYRWDEYFVALNVYASQFLNKHFTKQLIDLQKIKQTRHRFLIKLNL